MNTFGELIASRKAWIAAELKPWCLRAALKDLRLAEQTWNDIAGKVDAEKTLWFWAWSRFPDLVNVELQAIDETRPLRVTLRDGRSFTGFPDGRQSRQGELVLLCPADGASRQYVEQGPFPLDQVATVECAG